MKRLQRFLTGVYAGTFLLGNTFSLEASAQDTGTYESLGSFTQVESLQDLSNLTTEGFSILLIYSTKPKNPENMKRGVDAFASTIGELEIELDNTLTLNLEDMPRVKSGKLNPEDILDELSLTKNPSIKGYCNGKSLFKINGTAPYNEELVTPFKERLTSVIERYDRICR